MAPKQTPAPPRRKRATRKPAALLVRHAPAASRIFPPLKPATLLLWDIDGKRTDEAVISIGRQG